MNHFSTKNNGTKKSTSTVGRRQFLVSTTAFAAGSLVIGVSDSSFAQTTNEATTAEINAWVVIQPDDRIIVRVARSEMGQGTLTGLAQLVAEELEADWTKVSTEYPTPGESFARKRPWGNFATGGSRGLRDSQEYMRRGGAAARMMLVQAAASTWNVPAAQCVAANSVVTHTSSGRQLSYGKLAALAARQTPPSDVVLKEPQTWKIAGKPLARLDTVAKTNGSQIYGTDLKLPGMLNAAIRACPVFGGKVKTYNAASVEKLPGVVKVLAVGDYAVAVVADTWWRAKTALDKLVIEWDNGPNGAIQQADINSLLKEGLTAERAAVGNSNGDVKQALAGAARTIEAVYSYPHQNHATMEPMNAIAKWTPTRCEVWTPTQNGEAAHAATSESSGLPLAQCEVYKVHLGGGFGRRGGFHDWVRQAVAIAKQMPGTPVKLLWSREEDMTHGAYHPITQCKLTAGLDASGNINAFQMRISGQSILAAVAPQSVQNGLDPVVFQGLNPSGPEAAIGYTFPHLLIDHAMRNPHVPPGFWRGVNLNQNTIYVECFLDEIALATKQDPLAMRRKLMSKHPKHLAVLNAVAEKINWAKPAADIDGEKVFRGLAQCHGFGSYVAACAEVSVNKVGELKVHRIVAATDCGNAANPQQIEAQVEGSFVYGLSALLFQTCTVKNGAIEQKNFNTYPTLKMDQMPKVETIVLTSGGFWGGVGEPTIAVAAPAVLNAILAATGKPVRNLPIAGRNLRA
jgi:isoquinoline 1-oxidoreductase subunit beta